MDKSVISTCYIWPSEIGEANNALVSYRQFGIRQPNAVMTEGNREEGARLSVFTTTCQRMFVFGALCLLVSGYGSGCLLAQDPQSDPYHFSPPAQPVLDRLDSLQMLAAKEW